MVIVFIIISNLDLLINQFTRGYGHVELTGRDIIWGIYSDYIKNHFLLGNNSQKYFINMDGNTYHAHNSYLQLLATNGFIISLFYFILIIINIKKNNFPYIFPVLLFALTQYVIFWGISLEDVFFLYFLLSPKYFRKDPKENTICESSDTIRGYCT
jgi:O-antigen ligase